MKKKILIVVLSIVMMSFLGGCNSAKDKFDKGTEAATTGKSDSSNSSELSTQDTANNSIEQSETSSEPTVSLSADTGTKNPKVLVMGTNAAFPPFEFVENGQVVGIDPSVMALIAKEMGMSLEIVDMEFDSLPLALAQGKIDIIAAGFTINPKRQESMDFTDTYYSAAQTVVSKVGTEIASAEAMAGMKIGVQSGTTGQFIAEEIVGDVNQIKGFENGMLAVEALKNGQVDAVIIDNNPARVYGAQNEDTLALFEGLFEDEEYAYAVLKDNEILLDNVNKALAKIKENGEFDKLIEFYIQ